MPRTNKDGTLDRRGARKGEPSRGRNENRAKNHFKTCTQCGKSKRLTDFHRSGKFPYNTIRISDPRFYASACKECRKVKSAKSPTAKQSKPRKKKKTSGFDRSKYKRNARRETRVKVFEYLANKGCCRCGIQDPRVLEFDHTDPAHKKVKVSRLVGNGYAWGAKVLRDEILKCRVICANCHRLHTKKQQNYYSHPTVAAELNRILKKYGYS